MTKTISVRIDETSLKDLNKIEEAWKTERSEAMRRLLSSAINEWKKENALKKLSQHKISLDQAAQEANLSLWETIDLVKEKNIDWTSYTEEDLEEDLKLLP
ncbi:hypothetical protein CMI48_01585 [Candidatus Pacearchaeota archaeon]|nr:hypothetical protein [Candidatus Pacearchaeota archaeon]|tara:strand:- start:48 stop:350 length:303 start_codon:yes stop_codon:yes gene_type:complete